MIRARANEDSAAAAERLGYGSDVAALTRDHDLTHARLCAAFGLPSHSLRLAAGLDHDPALALLEEDAACTVQRWAQGVNAALNGIERQLRAAGWTG